jgi:protein-L-isoaspartate(D-aspartate) O-methyltransferase
MANVPRHRFVPTALQEEAYADHPLPIGHGQTISQPFIVALMTQALDPQPGDRCLEIGTGSAYQTAVLASLVDWVYSLEIIPELFHRAREILCHQQVENVSLRLGDGHRGWPEQAPFNAILVACATPAIPTALFDQLADHGRLVVPVGERDGNQELFLIERHGNRWLRTSLLPVRFVPMTGSGSPELPET